MPLPLPDCGYAFNGTRTWPNCTGFYHCGFPEPRASSSSSSSSSSSRRHLLDLTCASLRFAAPADDDETCSYGCLAIEYLYWTLQSLLGYQDGENAPPGRCEQISDEWQLCNVELMEEFDPVMTAVLRSVRKRTWFFLSIPFPLPGVRYNVFAKTGSGQTYRGKR